MADGSSPNYKTLFLEAEERRKQAEEERQAAAERTQNTTFNEYLRGCHNFLSLPLQVGDPARSTKGTIQPPTGKCCPLRFREWGDFPVQQATIYQSICRFLQPSNDNTPRLFSPLIVLEEMSRRVYERSLSSEKDLENYERFAVEDHVRDIIKTLSGIPGAQSQFGLGDAVQFDNHANVLGEEADKSNQRAYPDQYYIHRRKSTSPIDHSATLLMTVEYKPPHKLSTENLVAGLRPINFWEEVVQRNPVPTGHPGELNEGESLIEAKERAKAEKLRYNAALLAGSAIVQEYHVMIEKGLAYSYVSTGEAFVFLYVPKKDPETLYYHLAIPNKDVQPGIERSFYPQAMTAVARVLCFCLISHRRRTRSQAWREKTMNRAQIWPTSLDHIRSEIPDEELQQSPPDSEYIPSSPIGSPLIENDRELRPQTPPESRRLESSSTPCSSSTSEIEDDSADSTDSESNQMSQRPKRRHSQIASSPPQPRQSQSRNTQPARATRRQRTTFAFCTQRCLLGLRQGGSLDEACPNVSKHKKGSRSERHVIDAQSLLQLLKQQLDQDLDHYCNPWGECGAYGAPFKITSTHYGYTVIGKGTTSQLWKKVSREATVYQHLQKAQASAVPVFLGSIDLTRTYFHEAGRIKHMLLMAWGGETVSHAQVPGIDSEIQQSMREISNLGIIHNDRREQNLLWNTELGRVLIIDFHDCIRKPVNRRVDLLQRKIGYHKSAPEAKRRMITKNIVT